MAQLAEARLFALKTVERNRRQDVQRVRDELRRRLETEHVGLVGSVNEEHDRALAMRLILGVTAACGELDRVIQSHYDKPLKRLEPNVLDALRIAAFEALYLETPDHVAVSQGVELARHARPQAAGLANAILHRVVDFDVPALEASRGRLATGEYMVLDLQRVGGLPEWLAARAYKVLGPAAAADFARRVLEPACPSVAANLALHSVDETRALLAKVGCEPTDGPVEGSFKLGSMARLTSSPLVRNCDVLPCDLAAQEVVSMLPVGEGTRVLEVGSGRGTKSILMAARGGEVTAVEVGAERSRQAAERMGWAGVGDHVLCVCDDGRWLKSIEGAFDLCFVDVPCSGTGTLSRHPEIAWRLDAADVESLSALQLELLTCAAAHVAKGATLAYSTCSILSEENEDVVSAFLASEAGRGFELADQHRTSIEGADRHFLALLRVRD